jgi:hypothetical protein
MPLEGARRTTSKRIRWREDGPMELSVSTMRASLKVRSHDFVSPYLASFEHRTFMDRTFRGSVQVMVPSRTTQVPGCWALYRVDRRWRRETFVFFLPLTMRRGVRRALRMYFTSIPQVLLYCKSLAREGC